MASRILRIGYWFQIRMILFRKAFLIFALCCLPHAVWAEIQSQGEQEKLHEISQEEWSISFSGLADFRFVHTGSERNWQNGSTSGVGGRGRTRYGGRDTDQDGLGNTDASEFHLSQFSLVSEVKYKKNYFALIQINFDDLADENDRSGNFGITQAFLGAKFRLEENWFLETKFGQLFPPISLEHPRIAWTTKYTVTPSAINSWVSEELRPTGAEFRLLWEQESGAWQAYLLPFSRNDTAGTVLSFRGWAIHDFQSRTGSRLRVNQSSMAPTGSLSDPYKEIDGALSYLAGLRYDYKNSISLQYSYWDSSARQNSRDFQNDYAWNTRFHHLGFRYHVNEDLTFLHQYLIGSTKMGPDAALAVDNDIWSWYLLASYVCDLHRFSIRYEQFGVKDLEATAGDDNNSRGSAWTLAYIYGLADLHSIGLEYINVESRRAGNDGLGSSDPDDNLLQLSTRLYF